MKFVLTTSFSTISHLTEIAPIADQCGWHAMSFSDHVIHPEKINTPYPYTDDGNRRWQAFTDWPDPFVMIGALATITQQIRFMNNVFVLPMRNPFLVAKSVATASIVSNNRVSLCIGVGWSKDEFELLQQDFHSRGKRCDEMIDILRLLWQGGWVEHHGKYYDFDRLEMSPAPTERIPIWVGGISDAALKRAALLGDGWISDLQSSADIIGCVNKINRWREEAGVANKPFDVMATPSDAFTVDAYQELEANGITHIMTQPWPFYHGFTEDIEEKKDGIRRYAEDIIARM